MAAALAVIDSNGLADAIANTLEPILPTPVPLQTTQFFNDNNAGSTEYRDDVSWQLADAVRSNVQAQGMQTDVPFEQQILQDFQTLLPGGDMAFIDTSLVTTGEQWNDMKLHNPVVVSPWSDRSHETIREFDPLFAYRSDRTHTSPGFTTVATPPIINRIQMLLVNQEREAGITGVSVSSEVAARRQLAGAIGADSFMAPVSEGAGLTLGSGGLMPANKRMRLYSIRNNTALQPQPRAPLRRGVDSVKLEHLRRYASLTPEGLYEMIDFLGPVSSVKDGDTANALHVSVSGRHHNVAVRERTLTYTHHFRGQIANIFSEKLHPGNQLWFTISKYARDDLLRIKTAAPYAVAQRGKRTYQEVSVAGFVGANSYTTDEFVQVRGWSSNESSPYLSDSSALGSMKPDVADRFYAEREVLAAVQWQDYRWDDDAGKIVRVVSNEGAQEALNNIPSLVLENFLTPGIVIKVGTVKQKMNRATTTTDILNAHYDEQQLSLQPSVEIYQHC